MTRETVSSIWLVPSAADMGRLQPIIDEIAARQSGVSFQPHLTLGSLTSRAPDLTRFCREASPVQLDPVEIDATPVFTTSLFIRFSLSEELSSLRTALEYRQAFTSSRSFDPHLSLSYGAPPPPLDQKEKYSDLLAKPILFDQIWAVEIAMPVTSYEDIRSWRVIEKEPLDQKISP